MESTSLAGRVQISQSTAELLRASGKEKWFSPRGDKIHAKGKGELQTYWLDAATRAPSTRSSDPGSKCDSQSMGSEDEGGLVSADFSNMEEALRQRIETEETEIRRVQSSHVPEPIVETFDNETEC